jgi:hypothetical protein
LEGTLMYFFNGAYSRRIVRPLGGPGETVQGRKPGANGFSRRLHGANVHAGRIAYPLDDIRVACIRYCDRQRICVAREQQHVMPQSKGARNVRCSMPLRPDFGIIEPFEHVRIYHHLHPAFAGDRGAIRAVERRTDG